LAFYILIGLFETARALTTRLRRVNHRDSTPDAGNPAG
jgi:hypothetical protein